MLYKHAKSLETTDYVIDKKTGDTYLVANKFFLTQDYDPYAKRLKKYILIDAIKIGSLVVQKASFTHKQVWKT